jgi:hypothetical protein
MKESTKGIETKGAQPPDGVPARFAKSGKKAYRTPTLIEYGPISRLAQSGGTVSLADAGQSMRMSCL